MYGALRLGGPRWTRITFEGFAGIELERVIQEKPPIIPDDMLNDVRDWIESENPDIDQLDAYLDQF